MSLPDRSVEEALAADRWRDIATAPRDGTPIVGSELYRYQPYKPDGQRQMRKPGRWQRYNGYGWENAEPPTHWMPVEEGN